MPCNQDTMSVVHVCQLYFKAAGRQHRRAYVKPKYYLQSWQRREKAIEITGRHWRADTMYVQSGKAAQ